MKPRLLWVGDAGCVTGFAKATHNILETLRLDWDVTVLALNYWGDDPQRWPYPMYSCFPGGDSLGVGRLIWMCDLVKPDVIVIQNDGWHIQPYVKQLRNKKADGTLAWPEHADIPIVVIVAVDGKNFKGRWLEGVSHAIFWTQFALDEARTGGYGGSAEVIPLGVNLDVYSPGSKDEACESLGLGMLTDRFVVGNINRNQPRKRWDLTIRYFANWVQQYDVPDAVLYLHVAPTGDMGIDVEQMAEYYGVLNRLVLMKTDLGYGATEAGMATTYRAFDLQISTTQGEGFGLTTIEGMACEVAQLVPEWAALGDWARGGAQLVPCTSTALNPVTPNLNVVGGVADEAAFVAAMDALYRDEALRRGQAAQGRALAVGTSFRWPAIGARYLAALAGVVGKRAALAEAVGVGR